MMLHTYGRIADPAEFNNWLKANGGYVSGCLMVWGALKSFTFNGKVGRDSVKA